MLQVIQYLNKQVLNYRIICYRELASQQPGTQSALLLGDAYISILEPDKAIEVYETALKKNPRDATLASKIGQALVRTHNYNKVSISHINPQSIILLYNRVIYTLVYWVTCMFY